ncbi:uncharacterized protein ARMOST_13338 [Armillaria ostoyae]|uniref:DUF7918 domain-containing protein n=1 Tax=Armillaria ostoyae TaxID=47428 RepID=A0A284RMG4_ARMOS|nr:uncharacterized protein ARMOST_13338 [Armillaria ostoyae]
MLTYDHFSAWVTIEGIQAKEYQVEVTSGRVTCWIPSEANKTFKIHWKDNNFAFPTKIIARVDGTHYGYYCILQKDRRHQGSTDGIPITETSRLPFMFSNIKLSGAVFLPGERMMLIERADNDDLLDQSTQNVGEIHVEISKCHVEKKKKDTLVYYQPQGRRQIHEREKKGADHQVGFAAAVPNRRVKCSRCRCTAIGPPVVIFSFKYRPLAVLQANGIAPPPTPVSRPPTVPDIIEISDDDEEINALKVSTGAWGLNPFDRHIYHSEQARLQVLEGKRLRRVNTSTGSASRKKIKLEHNKREIIKVEDPGQTFEIHFKLHGAPVPLRVAPYVDGAKYSWKLVRSDPHQQYEFSGVRISETTRRPYKFSRLTLTDNDDAFNQSMQNVGDIEVEISRVQLHRIPHTHGPRIYKPIPDAGEYSEKTKKGIDHQVDFGDPVVTHRTRPQEYRSVPVGNPLVVFCFKYRPLSVLRALDIAPSPRGPAQRATETTAIDLTSDGDESETDTKELEALKAIEGKRKRREGAAENRKKIKLEPVKMEDLVGQVIDLT